MPDRYMEAENLSEGWLTAVRLLESTGNPWKDVHLILRIADPVAEVDDIRSAAQALIDRYNRGLRPSKQMPHIDTTRNTIFPAAFARRTDGPADLADYYRARYDDIKGYPGNKYGTYFGRVVAHPGPDGGPIDQLTHTVEKIRDEVGKARGPLSSRYEISIYNPTADSRRLMSFPCLAHLSIHLHHGRIHAQAIYRNESLVPRAYGNYLGLGQLQAYIAQHTGMAVGELMMTLGHVEMGVSAITPVRKMLSDLDG